MTVRRRHIAGPVLAAVTMTLAACGGTPHTAERPMASAAAVGDTAAVALVPGSSDTKRVASSGLDRWPPWRAGCWRQCRPCT